MKKMVFYITTALLTIFLVPTQVLAGSEDKVKDASIETVKPSIKMVDHSLKTVDADEAMNAESEALLERLEEINEMDKSEMSRSEKKELRNEVRQIDKALGGGGVYLSVGALVLVIVLLILLL